MTTTTAHDDLLDALATITGHRQAAGLNHSDHAALCWLAGGPMTAGELADHIGLSKAATTSVIDRLTAAKLATARRSKLDRRRILVTATIAGHRRIARGFRT